MGNPLGTRLSGTLNPGVSIIDSSHAQLNNKFNNLPRSTTKQAHQAGNSTTKFENLSVRDLSPQSNDHDLTRELNIGE